MSRTHRSNPSPAFAILLVLAAAMTTACNTIKGVGQDVTAIGQGMADVADDLRESPAADTPRTK